MCLKLNTYRRARSSARLECHLIIHRRPYRRIILRGRVFTLCKTAHCIAYYPEGRPRRINNRNSRASESKASSSLECSAERSRESTKLTFYCVKHHEQPFRACACLRLQNSRFTGWRPLLRRGGRGRGGASPSRRGRVR